MCDFICIFQFQGLKCSVLQCVYIIRSLLWNTCLYNVNSVVEVTGRTTRLSLAARKSYFLYFLYRKFTIQNIFLESLSLNFIQLYLLQFIWQQIYLMIFWRFFSLNDDINFNVNAPRNFSFICRETVIVYVTVTDIICLLHDEESTRVYLWKMLNELPLNIQFWE